MLDRMREGQASQTAVLVAMGRAVAHLQGTVPGFSDPTALTLLPREARERVERFRDGPPPATAREKFAHKFLERRSQMMAVRTVAIDQAVREADARQVVILGAGLDGRAWRMPELGASVVFEVDHPDTQREKVARAAALIRVAREVRFVPVDFTRDRLDEQLTAAGHDPTRPTTWIWEGVVMYLTKAEVEATLEILARRSAPRSRLIIAYATPGLILPLVRMLVRRLGEPFRSVYTEVEMKATLAAHRFEVTRDDGVPALGRAISEQTGRGTRWVRHLRIVVAESVARAP
jgi:methyltransferase (TIGR00027 family)